MSCYDAKKEIIEEEERQLLVREEEFEDLRLELAQLELQINLLKINKDEKIRRAKEILEILEKENN